MEEGENYRLEGGRKHTRGREGARDSWEGGEERGGES